MPAPKPRAPAARRAAARAPAAGPSAARAGHDRPTRDRLLHAGLAIARRSGLRSVVVRAVAARARVNLGSFVYHFGSRDAFIAELMEHWYAPFYAALQVTVDGAAAPQERLRALLVRLADFLLEHRGFVAHVLMDAAAGEGAARRFMQSLAGRHPALVLQAIVEAQRAGQLLPGPPLNAMAFLFAALGGPILMLGGLVDGGLLPKPFAAQVRVAVLDRAGAEQRIEWALRALAPTGVHGTPSPTGAARRRSWEHP